MSISNKPIVAQLSLEGLLTINMLAIIAAKAHGINPSPVEIKLQLASMNKEMLFQLIEDTARLIDANKPITTPGFISDVTIPYQDKEEHDHGSRGYDKQHDGAHCDDDI